MSEVILSLDQGTTSSRALLVDQSGKIVSVAQKEFEQIFPQDGWVEHRPNDIWDSQFSTLLDVFSSSDISLKDVVSIGITNQRETTIIWNRKTGEPIYNAIVWQDRRTAALCDQLKEKGLSDMFAEKTGLVLDAYFSGTKIKWILDNVSGAREMAKNGELAFGTVDSWLIWKLTDGKQHLTDVTNASRTLLFNIHTLEWDEEILALLDIPKSLLPEVKECVDDFGTAIIQDVHIRINGVAGDQHAALFGQMCTEEGMGKCTYGTGCFAMLNTGSDVIKSQNKLLSTIAWKFNGEVNYALEGSVFIGGAVIQWLRNGLQIIENSKDVEALAQSELDNGGVYFVPAFVGIGAPYWDQYARGMMIGIGRNTSKGHIARAAQEAIAYQVYDLIVAMKEDMGESLSELRVDGGASANDSLIQFQSDLINTLIHRPKELESTALGVAFFAGLGSGFWKGKHEIRTMYSIDKSFTPNSTEKLQKSLEKWHKAVNRCLQWAN